jgi:hypothetical protein
MELLLYTPLHTKQGNFAGTFFHKVDPTARKVDLSGSRREIPNDSDSLEELVTLNGIAYGIVGPSIVTFGLIGNILILVVVGKSSMKGKPFKSEKSKTNHTNGRLQ